MSQRGDGALPFGGGEVVAHAKGGDDIAGSDRRKGGPALGH